MRKLFLFSENFKPENLKICHQLHNLLIYEKKFADGVHVVCLDVVYQKCINPKAVDLYFQLLLEM
jgi:hypothetical protein